jgi:hypothetical protein
MADIRRIVDLYELYGSSKKVARELSISLNTAKKYLRRVNDVQEGTVEEILPKDSTKAIFKRCRQKLDTLSRVNDLKLTN